MKCSKCGQEVDSSWKMCPYCGEEIKKVKTCPVCNKEVQNGWKMCPYCGKQLEENSSSYSDFSNNYNGGTSFVDFEKTYKMNKEEEERIAREKEEKERLARLKAEQEEKERKAREAKLAAERAEKERKERERQEQLAKERAIKAEQERINSLITNGSIPSLSSDRKTVTFGKYHYSEYGNPKSLVLSWRVLSINNGLAFVVLDDVKCYIRENVAYDKNEKLSWSTSYVREWLNNNFYNSTFDSEAKKYIAKANTVEGCADYVFLLTKAQIENKNYGFSNGSVSFSGIRGWLMGTYNDEERGWDGEWYTKTGIGYVDSYGYLQCDSYPSAERSVYPALLIRLP